MTPGARAAAAIEILDQIISGLPAEKTLTGWARRSRFAGSKDRAAIRDHVFDALRRRDSYAWLGGSLTGRGVILGQTIHEGGDVDAIFSGQGHAPLVQTASERDLDRKPADVPNDALRDMPDWIFNRLRLALGERADQVCLVLRDRAPVHVRVNIARITLVDAQKRLSDAGFLTEPHPLAETALTIVGDARGLDRSQPYLDGEIELQDISSQAAVQTMGVWNGARVLDYCAGGGGKALALAALGADVTAHDAAPVRMRDLVDRARRAGAAIATASLDDLERRQPFDCVLVDAPCSGSGSWRRTPDAKWRLTPARLEELQEMQASILDHAAEMTALGGTLAYATCSLLAEENSQQVQRFLRANPGFSLLSELVLTPLEGCDGFYMARMRRNNTGLLQSKVEI